ncbi:MAG: hypothetical protein OET44_00745 [Gammaproteobacteria bacterium]|nr:hypothetical protein [Gammaproteobacteria bacterium]
MQHLNRLPLTVRILAIGQFAFALAIVAITGHGLATLDYAPYETAFFTPIAEQIAAGTLTDAEKSTVEEIIRRFPVEVNHALQLSRHADKTALAAGVCMLILPLAMLFRAPGK